MANAALKAKDQTIEAKDQVIDLYKQRVDEIRESENNREELIRPYISEFNKIDSASKKKLISKLRPAAIEIGYPLYRSTEKLMINEGYKNVVFLDKISVEALKGHTVSDTPETLLGEIIQYNKETGWGKFRNSEYGVIGFRVPAAHKEKWSHKIIDCMKLHHEIIILFFIIKDSGGNIVHLTFDGFLKEED
jgi:hypothetical protein